MKPKVFAKNDCVKIVESVGAEFQCKLNASKKKKK